MNREDIIRMAREAGVQAAKLLHEFGTEGALCDSEIQDLRAAECLAEAAYAAGAAAEREIWMDRIAVLIRGEREACAKVCEDAPEPDGCDLAERIRARSNT